MWLAQLWEQCGQLGSDWLGLLPQRVRESPSWVSDGVILRDPESLEERLEETPGPSISLPEQR